MRPRSPRQQLQHGPVRIRQLTRDVKPEPRAAGPRGEERLEYLPPQLRRNARSIVVQLEYYGIAHVSGARDDANAAVPLLAVLPGVAHQVPDDLVQVATVERHKQIVRDPDRDASRGNALRLDDLLDERGHELVEHDRFGL